jgi:glycosyltransferase involved in cell wall biosynthesis
MLVGRQGGTPEIHCFDPQEIPELKVLCRKSGGLFYALQGSHRLFEHPLIQSADIVHLHNLHGEYFNPFSLPFLAHTKPVVWTLHDMQSFTGHCAHSFDCDHWRQGCGQCPYLGTEPAISVDTTARLLAHKRLIYEHSPLWIVTPSNWLKAKVEQSILGNHPVDTIYNGVDTSVFKPLDRVMARQALGLPRDKLLVGAVANGGAMANPWKGGEYTEAAMDFLQAQNPGVCFVDIGGKGSFKDPGRLSIPHIDDESRMALAYNALDLFLYTPRADNCPLVVLEAMACGLPMASFDTGGIPELVQDGQQDALQNSKISVDWCKQPTFCWTIHSSAAPWAQAPGNDL